LTQRATFPLFQFLVMGLFMDLHQALQEVGYTSTRKDIRRHNLKLLNDKPPIEAIVDEVFEPVMRPRKVIFTKAGGMVRARYEGRKTFVFGFDERHASNRLKTWDGGTV
jgi:hypothetical protein